MYLAAVRIANLLLRLLVLLAHETEHTRSALDSFCHAVIYVRLHASVDVHPALHTASLKLLPGSGDHILTVPAIRSDMSAKEKVPRRCRGTCHGTHHW